MRKDFHSEQRTSSGQRLRRNGMGGWGTFIEFIGIRVQRFLLLLVSTVSDTSVEEFVFLSCRGFLFNTTTDRFTLKKTYLNCTIFCSFPL